MRFTGTVLAVLLANILTLALLAGAYVYLKSDHGQILLYELGLHSVFFSLASSRYESTIEAESSGNFVRPRLSDMKPMRVEPSQNRQSQASNSPPEETTASSSPRRNQSAINSSLKMCRFWNAEYKKDGSSQSKAYRNSACKRYERLSGRDGSNVVALGTSQPAKSTYQEQRQREEQERQARREAKEQREHELYCDRVRERIDHYDSLLRAGGRAHYVNRLRRERKEISLEYSRKCLLGQ